MEIKTLLVWDKPHQYFIFVIVQPKIKIKQIKTLFFVILFMKLNQINAKWIKNWNKRNKWNKIYEENEIKNKRSPNKIGVRATTI